ncbi:MAG TPA: arginine--tRNA ligase [archaeon]|nr:arginine--tRNA ligase [archaeon]HRT02392.1 arginine--tRNA ligase [Candidatus Diapherotrites archaeon]
MDYKEEFANILFNCLNQQITIQKIKDNIEIPSNNIADLAFTTFFLAKIFKKNPKDIAEDIIKNISKNSFEQFDIWNINGYVNLKIKPEILAKQTIEKIITLGKNYGKTDIEKKQYVLDEFNLNPLKTFHVGHLRMAAIGNSIYRIYAFMDQNIKPIYYGGDIGTHVAKWLWYYKSLDNQKQKIPDTNKSKWFGEIYMSAEKKYSEDPNAEKEIEKLQQELINNNELQQELKKLVKESFQGYLEIAQELGITLEKYIFESQAEKKFLEIKNTLLNNYKNIIYESDGAIIADLKKYELGILVLVKSNGALLYGAKDIGNLLIKKETYPECTNYLYVTDYRQEHYFKQLFKLFELLFPETTHIHISHGTVSLTSKAILKSREGNIILYEDFKQALQKKIKEILKEHNLENDNTTINILMLGIINFEMLKLNTHKNLIFNIDNALDLNGDTAPYIQYSGVRAKSILKKINEEHTKIDNIKIKNIQEEEINLIKKMNELPETVLTAMKEFKPNVIANYAIELAHTYNKFYDKHIILCDDQDTQKFRILLTKSFLITLENALYLLNMKIPEKM